MLNNFALMNSTISYLELYGHKTLYMLNIFWCFFNSNFSLPCHIPSPLSLSFSLPLSLSDGAQ